MSESESVSSSNDSYLYRFEDNPVISSIVQLWRSLDFQQKLLIVLLLWLFVNLLLIRIAWRAYGHRLTEILTKGLRHNHHHHHPRLIKSCRKIGEKWRKMD